MIRRARPGDAADIAALWNRYIRETACTFHSVEKSQAEILAQIAARPVFVAEAEGFAGFGHYGPFRAGDGYRHTAEHTLYLHPAAQGRGLGRALMTALEDHARGAGIHGLWAGISAENPGGLAFHARMGFREVARLPEAGRKFDRWMDLVLMQKLL
jgi:phosphinothricin acetyltransferase